VEAPAGTGLKRFLRQKAHGESPSELDVLNGLILSGTAQRWNHWNIWNGSLFLARARGGNGLNEAKRLNGWNDWNGNHCEQGIFVSVVRNTKAKSKPPKP